MQAARLGTYYGYCVHMDTLKNIQAEARQARWRRYRERAFAADLLNHKRLNACGRSLLPGTQSVEVVRTPYGRAYYRGVMVCRMLWVCPVCAPFEFNKRQFMLAEYAAQWAEKRSGLAMLTLTFRHNRDMTLADTLARLKAAYRKFTSGRAAQDWRGALNIKHSVSATEITHGPAGWHPHLHILIFRGVRLRIPDRIAADGRKLWRDAGASVGIQTSHERAFDLRTGTASVAGYLAKYGRSQREDITREVVSGLGKRGRQGNRTPGELLTDAMDGDTDAAYRFKEYAAATRGRNLLVQSKGLAAEMGLADLARFTDTQVGGPRELGVCAIELTRRQWHKFVKAPLPHRLQVLEYVELQEVELALKTLQRIGVYDE